ncbi:Protein kinase superfamily protein [Striga hermonthica]|uniref:Protein kinase superfamily protein n=1 Tax=Striga hermonthica TaxID=68872 RepID=A0A9N7R990_STRHE|nr:Protein kinase superfamily protein [Striga hermonthica]
MAHRRPLHQRVRRHIASSNACDYCGELESIIHVLRDCLLAKDFWANLLHAGMPTEFLRQPRNDRIFNDRHASTVAICSEVLSRADTYMAAVAASQRVGMAVYETRLISWDPSDPGDFSYSYLRAGPSVAPSPFSRPLSRGRIRKGPLPLPAIPHNHLNGCESLSCTEPLTYTPPGQLCGCVWPIKVKLRFSLSVDKFFLLVPELAREITNGVPLSRDQVRIVGADVADQELEEKTDVLVNLVPPINEPFNYATAYSIYEKFLKAEFPFNMSVFGVYQVLYVNYPGLPSLSPPSRASSGSGTIDFRPYPSRGKNDEPLKPLGVDVSRARKDNSDRNMILIIIILSSVTAFVVCLAFILLLLSKESQHVGSESPDVKPESGSKLPSSTSISFSSSLLACTGTAKIFTIEDIKRATNDFNKSRILGEGGFGLVYSGTLDDGSKVAVKVLKRVDNQGGREFLAEVEMLGRLHHRNLVKLIGICAEDQCRCLVYELVPNGSVESHLHGVDKEIAPLNWSARMKIAVGAARGLAYLHEDSSPRVIHRDFKSSNILLEHDYTPKVSDFGLARSALDEGNNKHISTHVMGTFGYLAPEYAMTGHLLVKSDVYSYGVVLLELLTGRKPVDLTQPPGQENLVSWARPVLTSSQWALDTIMDPLLKPGGVPPESFARVAAIASMCVQPEVSHRPFMGEVVQALKLVCDEFERSRSFCSQEELLMDVESIKESGISGELGEGYGPGLGERAAFSGLDLRGEPGGFGGRESESFRREFNSAPLKMERTKRRFWDRVRGLSGGSMSEHEYLAKL